MSRTLAFPGIRAAAVGFIREGAAAPSNPTQAETTTLLAAMTVQPSAGRQTVINDLIFALKGAGVWAKLDFFFMLAAHDAQAARINWFNPAQIATASGGPVFTTDRGYAGDGVAAYLDTGLNPISLPLLRQNDASVGIWCLIPQSIGNGMLSQFTSPRYSIFVQANFTTRLCTNTSNTVALVPTNSHICTSRIAAAGYDRYINGALLDSPVAASTGVVTDSFTIHRSAASFSDGQCGLAHAGKALTATEIGNLYTALRTYMTAVGVP
jgi:hypothetical protein